MSIEIYVDEDDIVIAKDKKGKRYYVIGQWDECFEWEFDCAPVGKCMTWTRRYSIGTEHSYESPYSFWYDFFKDMYGYDDPQSPKHKKFSTKALAKLMLDYTELYVCKNKEAAEDAEYPYLLVRDKRKQDWQYDRSWYISTDNMDELSEDDYESIYSALDYLSLDEYESMAENIPDFKLYHIYKYEHGNISLSLSDSYYPFSDRWDAGPIGYFYATKEEVEHALGHIKELGWEEAYRRYVHRLIEEFNLWCQGQVYTFAIVPEEEVDAKGLDMNELGYAICCRVQCWSGGNAGRFDDLMKEWCNENGLEIIGVVEK